MSAKQCGIEAFLEMMAAERGAAANTLEAYRRDLDDYECALTDAGKSLRNAATDDIRAHLSALKRRGFAATTTARRLSAICQLHCFLAAEGHRKDDPAAILEGPRQAQRLPKILSVKEVAKLLETARAMIEAATEPREKLHATRNFCLLELLYATGLRVSELVSLPKGAARRREPLILVRGKGGRERMVPISDPARAAMTEYRSLLEKTDPRAAASPGFFRLTVRAGI